MQPVGGVSIYGLTIPVMRECWNVPDTSARGTTPLGSSSRRFLNEISTGDSFLQKPTMFMPTSI